MNKSRENGTPVEEVNVRIGHEHSDPCQENYEKWASEPCRRNAT